MGNVLHSSKSNEWYTPAEYVEAAREVMGSIDTDPASCREANETVKADLYYNKQDDGLLRKWRGNVWLNPPYGREAGCWISAAIGRYIDSEIAQAVLLVNAVTDRSWFRDLWHYPICFCYKRIRFIGPGGVGSSPTHGSAFVYLGNPHKKRFEFIFSGFGHMVIP